MIRTEQPPVDLDVRAHLAALAAAYEAAGDHLACVRCRAVIA